MHIRNFLLLVIFLASTSIAFAFSPEVEKAVKDLSSPLASIRQSAVMTIASSGETAAGVNLFQSLSDNDPSIRTAAIWALAQLKTPGAASRIVPFTYSSSHEHQRAAAAALGTIGDPAGGPALVNLTYSSDPSVVKASVNAIGQLKYNEAGPRLSALLSSSDPDLRNAAAVALKQLSYKAPSSMVRLAMSDEDMRVREASVSTVGGEGEGDLAAILPLLQDTSAGVRKNAAMSAGKTRTPKAVPHLVPLLGDSSDDVSLAAAQSLGNIGAAGIEALAGALPAAAPQVRKNIVKGLIAGGELSVPYVLPLLKENDLKKDAIAALTEIKSPLALDSLIRLFSDSDVEVQDAAALAVGKTGPVGLVKLSETVKSNKATMRRNTAKALGEIKEQKSINLLVNLLKDLDESVVITSSVSLGKIGEMARPSVLEALKSEDDMQRAGAINAISLMGKTSLPLLIEKLNDRSPAVRAGAAMGIGQMESVESLPLIVELLNRDQDPQVKKAAVWTMAKIGNSSLIENLVIEKTRAAGKKQADLVKTIERTITILQSK